MTPERHQQIAQLFHNVLELESGQRAAFLDGACAGDEALRREVESLLASHEQAAEFIAAPALEVAAKALAKASPPALAGQRIGHYQILSLLGKGGMGEVYLAEDLSLGRQVALKLLPEHFTQDADRVRRFEQEARAASALNHPNIITIHEIGQTGGAHYMVTEFIAGQTLREQIKSAKLGMHEVIEITMQIASALEAAHEAGIAHRDIKPENIMRRPDGLVKVLDFGLAKLTERREATVDADATTGAGDKTDPGTVMGTLRYMSPEQARGQKVDSRTDIFSLGVVTYEMVAGRVPFEGKTASDVLVSILSQEPPPLRQSSPAVSAELERIIAKALRKDQEERYQTSKDLLVDLKSLRQELGSGARTVSGVTSGVARATAEYLVSEIKSHKRGTLFALVMLILAAVSLAYFPIGGRAIRSVAVLPFTNVGANPETEYLADGITESLISNLSQLSELKVMSRAAVFRYKGREVDPQAVGRELEVQAVLVARVEPRGDSLMISLELVDVRDNRQIWGEQYNQKLTGLLQLQAEISRGVSEKLRLRLSGAEQQQLAKRSTGNAEAYDLYLKGRFHWNKLTEDGYRTAIQYFHQALDKDPNYALAYDGLACSYISLGAEYLSPKEAMPKAKAYAEKALKLDETLAEAHASLGIVKLVYDWDFSGAERELRHPLQLNPQLVETFSCALHFADPLGRNAEAIAGIKRALAVDPFSLPTNLELGCAS